MGYYSVAAFSLSVSSLRVISADFLPLYIFCCSSPEIARMWGSHLAGSSYRENLFDGFMETYSFRTDAATFVPFSSVTAVLLWGSVWKVTRFDQLVAHSTLPANSVPTRDTKRKNNDSKLRERRETGAKNPASCTSYKPTKNFLYSPPSQSQCSL